MSVRDEVHRHREDAAGAPRRRSPPAAARPATSWPPREAPDDAPGEVWVPPGVATRVKGLVIPGGCLYVGRRLDPVGFGRDVEPALIDPSLPVYLSEPDLSGTSLGYLLSYSRISPRARAGYLHWLWSGRQNPAAPIGYVFLYFYGLERRVLHDRLSDPAAHGELAAIRAEVERLLAIYHRHDLFRTYAARLGQSLEIIARLEDPGSPRAPDRPGPDPYELPAVTRFELARIAASGGRLPAAWALAWTRQAGDIPLRTAAQRCPDQFDRLFQLRYQSSFGEGLPLATGKTRLRLYYRPASPSFTGEVRLPVGDLPDPSVLSGPTHKLAGLANAVASELDAYSRLVGKHPDRHESLEALALLPAELATGAGAQAAEDLTAAVEAALGAGDEAVVEGTLLTSRWPATASERLGRSEAAALAQLLAARGVGLEPDVRFGGPVLDHGPVVLFRIRTRTDPGGVAGAATQSTGAAAALLQLLASVVAPAGPLDTPGADTLARAARDRFDLAGLDLERTAAKLRWASHADPGVRGLKRRLATLDQESRVTAGAGLIAAAAAAGPLGPPQVAALTRAHRALGLDPADLFNQVHRIGAGSPSHLAPSHLAAASTGLAGQAEVPAATGLAATAAVEATTVEATVRLSPERIRARLAETAEVAAFLGDIFTDDDPDHPRPARDAAGAGPAGAAGPEAATQPDLPPADAEADSPAVSGPAVAGLDAAHSELLHRLATRAVWSRAELEGLAGGLALLPDGALDTINEAAIDRSGEPVCEGDDPVEINSYALGELLHP